MVGNQVRCSWVTLEMLEIKKKIKKKNSYRLNDYFTFHIPYSIKRSALILGLMLS